MEKVPPKFLYKYRPVETITDFERLETMILSGEIYFGSSFGFNDIFDCRPVFTFDCSDEEFVHRSVEFIKAKQGLAAAAAIEPRIRAMIGTAQDARHPDMRAKLQEAMANQLGNWGVYCVAERPDNILMWSHYASSFRGVCIEIDSEEFAYLHKVAYEDSRPVIDGLPFGESGGSAIDKTLYTKFRHWEYEQEWRAAGDQGKAFLSQSGITRIIFGPRCPPENRAKILDYVKRSGKAIAIGEARADHTKYSINIVGF